MKLNLELDKVALNSSEIEPGFVLTHLTYNAKRYYLGDQETAYSVMRFLSLGIKNSDLRKIQVGEFEEK